MEQDESFLQKNRNYLIAGIIVAVAIVFFVTQSQDNDDQTGNDQENEQTNNQDSTEGQNNEAQENQNQNGSSNQNQPSPNPTPSGTAGTSGNVSATGKLKLSDDSSRGNLMLESSRGKIYISTKRDFSTWVDKDVTLDAQGTIQSFAFLGFKEAGNVAVAPSTDTTAKGGDGEVAGAVSFSGRLDKSDNSAKGNYVIVSGTTKIYLQSSRDYSGLTGSDVTLTAEGSLKSFTNAKVAKK